MALRKRPPPTLIKPQMTSLVDVLTVLVFFLLKNFSTEGDIVTPSAGLELPQSTSQAQPEKTLTIAISQRHIVAEGKSVALTAEEMSRDDQTVPGLAQWLANRRKTSEEISRFNAGIRFEGKLSVQADRKIPFKVLNKVLNTCGENGYSKFSLTVMKKDGG